MHQGKLPEKAGHKALEPNLQTTKERRMVVSYHKIITGFIIVSCLVFFSSFANAGVRILSDQELDTISAGNLSDSLIGGLDSLFDEDGLLEVALSALDSSFGEDIVNNLLESAGLIHVNAINSKIHIQTNINVTFQGEGIDLIQQNIYTGE